MIHYSSKRERSSGLRPFFMAVAVTIVFAPPLQAQLTLRQAAEQALAANRGLRGAELTLEARSAGVDAARGRLLPNVEVNAAYTRLNERLVLDLDPIRDAMISMEAGNQAALSNLGSILSRGSPLTDGERSVITAQTREQLEAGLPHFRETLKDQAFLQGVVTARQPIFMGGKILAGIRAAQAQRDGTVAARDAQQDAVLAETAQRYMDVLLATENLSLRKEARRTLGLHQQRALRLMEEGVIARHERMRADVALAEAEREEFSAAELLRIARMALTSTLGRADSQVTTSDTLLFAEIPSRMDRALETFEQRNPTLRQLRAGTQALEEKTRARRADFFPTIYGFGMYNIFDQYIADGVEPKWAIGIGASITLFDGVRRTHEWEEARLDASALADRTAETQRQLDLLLQSTVMRMDLAKEQYRQLTAAVEQADENLRLNNRRFSEGLGTSLEVIDARLSLDSVLLQRASALHGFYSRQLDVFRMVGDVDGFLEHWDTIQPIHDRPNHGHPTQT